MQNYCYFYSLNPLKDSAGPTEWKQAGSKPTEWKQAEWRQAEWRQAEQEQTEKNKQKITCAGLLAKFPSYFFLLDEQGQLACKVENQLEINLSKKSSRKQIQLLDRLPNLAPISSDNQDLISYISKNFRLFAFVSNKAQAYTLSDLIQTQKQTQAQAQEIQEEIALCFYGDFSEQRTLQNSLQNSFLSEVPLATALPSLKLYHFRELLSNCQVWEEGLLARAKELQSFAQEFVYCSICSAALHWVDGEYARLCKNCHNIVFPRQDPSVISLITWNHSHHEKHHTGGQEGEQTAKEWLLLGRNYRFRAHMYSLIAGFVDAGENLEQALWREAWEEAAVRLSRIQYLCSQAWPNAHSLMTGFIAQSEVEPQQSRPDGKEIESLLWLERSDLYRCLALDEQNSQRQDSHAMIFSQRDCQLPHWHISANENAKELFFSLPGRGSIARKLLELWANANI